MTTWRPYWRLLIAGIAMPSVLAMPATVSAQSAAGAAASAPPEYRMFRYDEDYRYLQDPARRRDFWDPVKYIRLQNDPRSYLSVGGELRERFEYYSAVDFGLRGGGADAYLLHRLLLHGDLHLGDGFRLFVQLGSHFAPGKDNPSAVFLDRFDLQQAFIDIRLPVAPAYDISPTLRIGRQEMAFGSQRLVAIRDAPNVRRAFDGVRLGDTVRDVRIDAFFTRPVQPQTGIFDDRTNTNQAFWGAYGTLPLRIGPRSGLDMYYLGFENDRAVFGSAAGREQRHTLGVRLFGTASGWDWDWEALGQFGGFAGQRIRASGASADSGFTFSNAMWTPRLGLKVDAASGDHDPHDQTLGTLNPLFPKLAYFSQAALLTPVNLFGVQPSLTVQPTTNLAVTLGWGFVWRQTVQDAIYIEPFTPVAGTAGRGSQFIGQQLALEATWRVDRHIQVLAAYVHFSVGDTLRAAGGRDVDFVMASVGYRF